MKSIFLLFVISSYWLGFAAFSRAEQLVEKQRPVKTVRPDPKRFERDIRVLQESKPSQGGIVFTGSSSIRLWKTLQQDFPGLPVVNQGFGGSVANDLRVYAETVVFRHAPKILVTYTGSNDLNAKLTVEEAFHDYTTFLKQVHEKLPQTRVVLTSVKISIKRAAQIPQVRELNSRLSSWAASEASWVRFVDCDSYLADSAGQPIRQFYVKDLLHLSPEGYAEWTKVLRPILEEEWKRVNATSES